MKLFLLGGATLLTLAAAEPAARATLFDITYTGSLVTLTVPTTDTYQILAFGAQGGTGRFPGPPDFPVGPGGKGAEIGGDFTLTAGEILQIAVGGAGSDEGTGGGGGGGSFVVGPGNTPLVIAGGGGGGGAAGGTASFPGGPGLTGQDGGTTQSPANNGTGGNGGGAGLFGVGPGGGGGGFFSAGGSASAALVIGGGAFPGLSGGLGGGGLGGGGGFGGHGSGGGGGYSGSSGGNSGSEGAGGGGSFDAGIDQILVADFRTGNGEVVITELADAVPEPASILLVSAGLAGLVAIRRRRRHI